MTSRTSENAASEAARHLDVSWDSQRTERNLARLHERRGARSRTLVGASVVGLAAVAAAFLFFFGAAPKVAAPRASLSAPAAALNDPKTTFADGSVARVSEGGELVVKLASAQHIESLLSRGTADFEVTKNPQRDFVVVAGSVRVRVVGTRFRVEQSGERTLVSVSEGKVEVQEGTTLSYLEAGESRFFPSQEPSAKQEPRPAAAVAAHARFLELARGGEFKAAYQVLSQSPNAVGSSAEELMLAADAARLSSHPEQAVGYLRRVTTEHAADSRAPLAAFSLGRVLLSQLGKPGEAAEAFALTRRLRPSGGLSEDALAREAEARSAAGSGAQARTLAAEYLARYPQGKHLPTMQKLSIAK